MAYNVRITTMYKILDTNNAKKIKNNDKELKKWIEEELSNEGEWWNDGDIQFIEAAKKMEKVGMSEDDIKEIFESLYSAVADEFGG